MTQSLAVNGPISMEIIIIGLNQYVIHCNLESNHAGKLHEK